MRDKKRIKRILKKIEWIWDEFPDERFFQLLFNYSRLGTRTKIIGTIQDPFFYEDSDIEQELDVQIKLIKYQKEDNKRFLDEQLKKRKVKK